MLAFELFLTGLRRCFHWCFVDVFTLNISVRDVQESVSSQPLGTVFKLLNELIWMFGLGWVAKETTFKGCSRSQEQLHGGFPTLIQASPNCR